MKRVLAIIGGAIAALLLLLCLTAYLIVNRYLKMINYVPASDSQPVWSDSGDSCGTETAADKQIDKAMFGTAAPAEALSEPPMSYAGAADTEAEQPVRDANVFNVLLIGTDSRNLAEGGRSDTMILISINKKTEKIVATSLLRDIYLEIPGYADGNRLNASYAFGGPSLLLETIRNNFDVQVDRYITVDFFSFVAMVDMLGGVTVDVSDDEVEVANGYIYELNYLMGLPPGDGLLTEPGPQTLDGKQALGYVRIRYVGNADFGRTDRQRFVLEQLFEKIKNLGIADLDDILSAMLPEVTTNLDKKELLKLIVSLPAYKNYAIVSGYIPADGTFTYMRVRGMDVLGIDFEQNISIMQDNIYN